MAGKAAPTLNPGKRVASLPSVKTHALSVAPKFQSHGIKPAINPQGTPKGL